MADTPFSYTGVQPGQAPMPDIMQDDLLLPQEIPEAYTPDPFDPFGKLNQAVVNQTPYEELLKRAKRRNPDALDVDFDGRQTEALGKEKGLPFDRDTVLGVEVYGEHVSNEKLAQMDGGKELLALAAQKRSGRRGFFEAIATGSGADFLPFVGDLASWGVSIKNMAEVRDTFRKMEAGQEVTLQEKVLAKLYEEDSLRGSTATWLGTAGSIIRTAPAFAAEFALTGGLFSAGKAGLTKVGLLAAKEAGEDMAVRTATMALKKATQEAARSSSAITAERLGVDTVLKNLVAETPGMAVHMPAMKAAAKTYVELAQNPRRIKAFTDGLIDYAKRGILDHGTDVVRDLPPGIQGKLIEAAGVAFIEAPIKGAMYAAFDQGVVNPIVAGVMGADEAVTKTELSITMAGAYGHDKELMDNAKMLAFGTAVAEYASESSGRAFSAVFGTITDVAGAAGRGIARRGIRAAAPEVAEGVTPYKQGSIARQLMDSMLGTEEQMKTQMRGIKRTAVEETLAAARSTDEAMRAGAEKLLGKEIMDQLPTMTADRLLAGQKDVVEQIVKDKMRFMDNSLIGYWVANKMLEKNFTPQKMTKWLETLGYDGIMGEYMEERYNGFAQGFFNLDGTPDKGFWDRIVKGTKQGFMPGWEQTAAEIFAFALPTVSRMAVAKSFQVIGAGPIGAMDTLAKSIGDVATRGVGVVIQGEDGLQKYVPGITTDADSEGVISQARRDFGKVNLDATKAQFQKTLDEMEEETVRGIPSLAKYVDKGETGFTGFLARSATALAAVLTGGNPIVGGFMASNPIKAAMIDRLGSREAAMLANSLLAAYKTASVRAQAEQAKASATAAEPQSGEEVATPTEATFSTAEKRAEAEFRIMSRSILRNYLQQHGTVMVDNKAKDSYVKNLFKTEAVEGKFAGLTETEFKKQFDEEILARAAQGDIKFDVIGGRARAVLVKKATGELSEMYKQAENFLGQIGVDSYLDLDGVEGSLSDRMKLFAGTPVDADLLRMAATDNGAEGDKAAQQMMMSGLVSSAHGLERGIDAAKEYARALLTANEGFFRPQYEDANKTRYEVRKTESGGYRIYNTSRSAAVENRPEFTSAAEAEAALATDGLQKRKASIYHTPTGTLITKHASMLLHPSMSSSEYLKSFKDRGAYADKNPVFKDGISTEQAQAELKEIMAMAERYANERHTISEADLEAHRVAFEQALGADGFETKAREYAETSGIRMVRSPVTRGELTYVVASAALNFGGEMYIPYKYAGSPTGVIEDSVESAVKGKTETMRVGDKTLEYGVFRDPANPEKWRPSILPLVNRIYSELTSMERRFENSTDPAEKRAAKEAKLMSGWFGQEYNSEGMSHMVSAFAFYRGLAAMGVGGTAQGGSAFYATLGRITEAVVTDHSYDALLSLVHRVNNRHVGGELTDASNLYAETLSGFIPPALMDYPIRNSLGIKTTVGRNAREAAARLANSINRAVEGRPPFTGVAEFANDEDSPEGRKARDLILAEMSRILARASMKGGNTRMGTSDSVLSYFPEDLIEIAEQAKANIIEAQRLEAAGVKIEATPEVQANVQAAAANSSDEVSGWVQGEPVVEVQSPIESIGPDGGPLGPNDEAKASFAEDAVNTSPAFAYDYAKRIAAANRQFMPSPDDDPMKLTADGAFDVWKKIDPLLEEKSREFFKAKMEKHVEKKKPQPAPVAFGEIFTEGVPEWMDVLTEDLTDDPETSGVSYSPDAIARALEKDMHARLFSGLSLRWFPQFRGDSSKVKTEIVLASRGVEGDSVGSLFDEAMWEADGGIHRAFENAETFEKFLSAANADAKSAWQPELKAFLLTLGYKSSFRLALRLKGSWMRDVVTIKEGADGITVDTAKASLSAGADRRLRAGIYSKLSQMKDPAVYRDKLAVISLGDSLVQGLEEMPAKARVVELAKRLIKRSTALADAMDAVAGPGTDLAGALRDPMTAWMKARETVKNWKAETVKSLVQTYGQYEFGKRERGGLLAMRISAMAEAYTESYKKARGDAKLQKDEAFLREASGRVASMLMRGSTIEAEAFAKADQPSRAGDRGVISSFLNEYASRFGQPVVSRTGLSRSGDYGAAKVRALNPDMAAGQKSVNVSEARMAVLLKAGLDPKSSDPAVAAYAQRLMALAQWPGYSLFAAVSSVQRKDGSMVSEATHDELERMFRASFDNPGDAVARAAITTTDKTEGSFAIQWPKTAMKELTGVDNPTYDQFYGAAAKLVGANRVSTKRSAVFLAQGWGITKQNARVGIDLTENLVGDTLIAGVYAKAAQLDGARENNKAHFTAVLPDGSVVFIKSKQRVQPTSGKAVLKDVAQAMSDAATEHKLDLYVDLDALKESELLSKDAEGRTALALFAAGNVDAEVSLPQGGKAKVSDLVAKYGLELQARKVGDKSLPLVIATIPGGLQMQYAANLTKSSKPGDIDLYTDFVRELVSPVTQSMQAQLAGAYLNRTGVRAEMEANALKSLRESDPWVAQLLDAGADLRDPDIYPDYQLKLVSALRSEFNAFRALGNKYAESSNGRTVVKDAEGDPTFTADGRFLQVSDSYGAPGLVTSGDTGHDPVALTHNAIAYTAEEAKRKGRTHIPSAVQVNNTAPGFRYAMRVRDGVGPMELRDRLSSVYSAMKESLTANDPSIYLKAYMDADNGLAGLFVNPDGSAVPEGAMYNIGDLFGADGKLDLSAIYDGRDVKTDAKGEAYTLIRGELLAGSRTPLDNQSSWRLLSAAEPVSTVKADGSGTYRYRKVVQTTDGFDSVMVPYPAGTMVPGPDAHIRMNEGDALLSGGDHDGDAGGLAQLRHDKYGRLILDVPGAAKALVEGTDDANAAKLFKASSEAVANAAVLEAIGKMSMRSVGRDLVRTGGSRGHALFTSDPIRSLTKTVERRAKTGIIESPLIEGGRIEHGPLVKPNLADAKSAAKFTTAASDNANLGRSKAVDTAAQVLIAHKTGIRLRAFGQDQTFFTAPSTLSEAGRIRFAQVMGASKVKDATRSEAAVEEFRNFAARAKNVTFDDLKEGIMTRAELYPAVIDLYVWLGYNSGAKTRAEFDEYHLLWSEWMRSPEGRNILKAYANKLDPEASGGAVFRAELDARISILKQYDRGDQSTKILLGLNPQGRDTLAAVMLARGMTGDVAIENLLPLATLLKGMTAMSNVKRVYDWKKLDAAYAVTFNSAARAVESVENLLLGKSGALTIVGEGREIEAAVLSAKAWVRTFAPIHEAGLYADKVRDAVVTAKFNRIEVRPDEMGGGVSVATPELADYDAAEKSAQTHLAWKAAVAMTPAETQAKIVRLVNADTATGAPVRFVTAVEKVWQDLFRMWARQMTSGTGKSNGAFEHLLPPSSENKLNRIAMMGSIDATDAIAVVGSGLEALRNWKPEETWVRAAKQKVFEKGSAVEIEVTPADAYWMLLQYATLTSGKGLDAGRAKQSLVPLFGAQVFAALGAGQVRMSENVSRKDALEAVTVAVYPKGGNRASKLTAAGGYDSIRFASKEIERRARLGVKEEKVSPIAEPVMMKTAAVEQPAFEKIAPVAEVADPDVKPALGTQTEASSAVEHMNAMLKMARAANAEDFRIPAMINGGVPAITPADVDAASKAALALDRFARLPWMANLTMAKAVSKAAVEATRELGFVDPSIPLALTLAIGRDAVLNNDADAKAHALNMMAAAGRYDFAKKAFPEYVISNERIKVMAAMSGKIRELTPRAILAEYILAADPRKLNGATGSQVERAIFGEVSASWADESGNETTDMDYKVLAAYRKNPYLPQGMALALVEANDAYKAYLAKGGIPSQGPEYAEAVRVGNLAMEAWDKGVKAEKQLMDRNGKERTDATSGLLPMTTAEYRQGQLEITASASDEFLDQADKLSEAARVAQEEITRGILNSDDRVKAYAGRMRSPHNAYWYEGTAPRHAEALFRMDAQASLSWTGKFMTTAFSDLVRQVEAIPGNANVIKRVVLRLNMLRTRLTTNNGGLPDPRNVRGDEYGKLMSALGLLQSGIEADTRELADMARTLGTPEGDAMAEQADDVYYGTAVALRVARSVLSRREFGEAGVAAPENISLKSGAVLETPVASIAEVALADVDTGMPDPTDDFNMAYLMTDYWLAATVLPSFQGVPLRDILMDKEPLAVVSRFIAMSNAMEAMFGTDSDTGSLRKGEKVPGGGHHLKDGGYVYDRERTKVEVTRYGRRKAVKELADIISGNAFSDSEYAMARWFTQAIYVWAGDGGSNGRQILGNTVDLYNLNWKDGLKDTLPKFNLGDGDKVAADGLRKLSMERRNHVNGKRPYDLDMLVHALDNNLPEPLRDRALAELVKALNFASIANTGAQGALKLLDKSGFIVPRFRDKVDADGNPTGQQEIYDARFSIPVSVTSDVFKMSTAHHKLILNGRKAEDLSLEKNGQAIRDEFSLARKSFRTLSWFTDGDGRMFTGGAAAPLSRGSGFFQYHARKRLAEVTPDYRAKVNEAYASLKDALDACLDRKAMQQKKDEQFRAGVPVEEISAESEWLRVDQAAGNSRYARMFTLFRDLSEGFEGTESPLTVAQMITSDKRYAHHGDGFGTGRLEMRSLAKAIYSMTVRKLHESAWDAGLAKPLSAEEAGMEAFNAAMEDSAAERSADLGRVGATFAEIYDLTGALPANLTAGEALAKFATETATALRYRGSLNQAMLSVDEYGMPLVYMEPGDGADDTIPDTVWQAAARMWVRAAGRAGDSKVTYDESKTGKENAKLLYPVMVDGKVGAGASRSASGGLDRYVMTDVKVPAGISAVKRAAAMKNPRGDDTYAAMDIFAGGEAAGQLEQLFAISGFTRTDMMLPQINRVLSWSKSLSVMNSFFFPIATAFESPIAAVGLWPTLFGLTSKGSDFFRKASEGGGALDKVLKAGGVDFDAPGMKDILKMIGTDDPALVEMKTHAILAGLSLADRSRNVSDHDRTALAKDVKNITAMVRKEWGGKSASAVKAMMEGLLEHSSEFAFEYVINATKIAVFAQMNNRLRAKALAAGRWWDPVLSMRKWAGYINAEVGGIDPATVAAMTPRMQNWLKGIMFSWEWTLGAWLAGGGGVITQKMFGMTSNPQDRGFMFGRWARMYFTVMVGLPAALQIIATGIAKAAGDDDDDDRWFTWQNEKDRAVKSFDITPLLRHIGKSAPLYLPGLPTWGELKNKLPADVGGILPVGAFIPALTGDEGDMVSSRKRRYYMRFGKQGWEVAAWFENPMSSFLGKMSMPLQRALEGVLGVTPSTGWETPFKELGFWERWLSLDGEKSATLNMLGSFMPFSYASMTRAPEAGALSMFGPVGKGMSKTRAEKEMQSLFENWADADSYAAIVKGNKGAWTDLKAMSVEYLDALRMNGYDPEVSLKQAVAAARKPLYDAVHSALPRVDGGAADIAALERAARGLNRLDYIHRDLLKSLKSKDKLQNIKRSKELKDISNAAIRESFSDPYGRGEVDARKSQSADLGGDVTAFLATDEIPKTVLGYQVVPIAEISPEDLNFFSKNPSAAGFFKKGNQ